jgi:hypothetical protein
LLDTFGKDCSKPTSKDNLYYTNRALDANHVKRDQMSGPTSRDRLSIIDKATEVRPDEIAVRARPRERDEEY